MLRLLIPINETQAADSLMRSRLDHQLLRQYVVA